MRQALQYLRILFIRSVCCAGVALGAGRAIAADLPNLPLAPLDPVVVSTFHPYFVRLGASAVFSNTHATATLGPLPPFIPATTLPDSGRTNTVPAASVEAGYYFTPNIAASIVGGIPPSVTTEGQNGLVAQGVLYRAILGIPTAMVSYHLTNFGPIRPYAGVGIGYAIVFRNESAAVINPFLRNKAAFVFGGGVDYDITDHWGVFVDVKKALLTQSFMGSTLVPTPIGTFVVPATASVQSDPVVLTSGISYRF